MRGEAIIAFVGGGLPGTHHKIVFASRRGQGLGSTCRAEARSELAISLEGER